MGAAPGKGGGVAAGDVGGAGSTSGESCPDEAPGPDPIGSDPGNGGGNCPDIDLPYWAGPCAAGGVCGGSGGGAANNCCSAGT